MAKSIVIVESPTKVKTINKILGKKFKVVSSMGHLIDLPKSTLGVDIENNFEPKLIVVRSKSKILSKLKKDYIEQNRRTVVEDFVKTYPCTLLLKGSQTLVAQADQHTYTNTSGNVGMATAGSGDVLSGIIGALLAQGCTPFESAKFGAYLHGKAGDLAARTKGKVSLIAEDIIEQISAALRH